MQTYVNQLIEDIREGKKYVPEVPPVPEEYEDFSEHMMALENSPEIILGDMFRLNKEMFPPVERLTDSQIEELTNEILSLWSAYNMEAVYPKNLPVRILYPLLIAKLDKPLQYWPGWQMGVEFCCYDTENCPFGVEYCTCKNISVYDFENDSQRKDENI